MKFSYKVYIVSIILFIASFPNLYAIDNIIIKLNLQNNANPPQRFDSLSFGVHILATDSIDYSLGEKEYPPIGLPSDIFMGYLIFNDARQNQQVWTWHDYRPFSNDSQHFYKEYNLKLFFGEGSAVTVSWQGLSGYIDSAKVQDPFAAYIDVNMKDTNSFTTDNILLDDFIFKVWFNTTGTSVEENNSASNSALCYLIDDNTLQIHPEIHPQSLFLYDIRGTELKRYTSNQFNNLYILPNLYVGIYFIRIIDIYGINYFDKIIIR